MCPSQESNPEPTDPKSGALSIELLRHAYRVLYSCGFVKDTVKDGIDLCVKLDVRLVCQPSVEGEIGILQ
jgi:hypothetical protein